MTGPGRILVVDDERSATAALTSLLEAEGFEVACAGDAFKGLGKLEEFAPELVLTDLQMPGMDGIELMGRIHERDRCCPVIVMTAFGAVDTAVDAMKSGAVDYLAKPVNFSELLLVVKRELANRRVRVEADDLRRQLSERMHLGNMIGSSDPMRRIFDDIRQVAPSRASVLITGETGTGKELVASAIHNLSPRASAPFVRVHCAALAETLLESELFGHERGAFTGAVARRDGRFQLAHGGTLFLDEIGEVSPSTQVKLLRFLQEHEFERVGSSQTLKVDVRMVAATNRDIEEEVRAGRFREDLYYRLAVVAVETPALRDRRADIPLLAQHFLRRFSQENAKTISGFSEQALHTVSAYYWPGNVRELENAVERAVVMARGDLIGVEDLPPSCRDMPEPETGAPPIPGSSLAEVERYLILRTLEQTGGSTSEAADILGISIRKIQYRLQEYSGATKSKVAAVTAFGSELES